MNLLLVFVESKMMLYDMLRLFTSMFFYISFPF